MLLSSSLIDTRVGVQFTWTLGLLGLHGDGCVVMYSVIADNAESLGNLHALRFQTRIAHS